MKSKTKRTAKSDSSGKMNSLGQLFKEKRIEAGYDIASLAIHALISTDIVVQLEASPQHVPLQDLYAVANVLNLDPGVVLELLHTVTR